MRDFWPSGNAFLPLLGGFVFPLDIRAIKADSNLANLLIIPLLSFDGTYFCKVRLFLRQFVGAAPGNVEIALYGVAVRGADCAGEMLYLQVCPGGVKISLDRRTGFTICFKLG